jgi:hypothetical protein
MVLIKQKLSIANERYAKPPHTVHWIRLMRPNYLTNSKKLKVLRDFLLAIQSHLDSFALRFLFLQTRATSYSFYIASLYTKEEEGKPSRKPYPLPYGSRNPYRNLKSENSKDCAQNPPRNCTFMNSASVHVLWLIRNEGG